jgi:N-acetylglucosamine-6-phosphate deacetylase
MGENDRYQSRSNLPQMIISAKSAVIAGQIRENVEITVDQGIITAINDGDKLNAERQYSGTLIPGFVDIHSHGGGGYYFSDSNPSHVKQAIDTHRNAGTTSQIASLVTADISTLKEQIASLIPFVVSGALAGIHLEGPYLSSAKCGAHNPDLLRHPVLDEVKSLIEAGQGSIRMVTIAPELEGAIESIGWLSSQGIVAAIGHSDADATTTEKAIAAGAQVVTHFSNAMSKNLTDESMATHVLNDSTIALELINDGVHVPNEVVKTVVAKALQRTILITDAMSAAGSSDGMYSIGGLDVEVKDSIARLTRNNSLAGSTLTMEKAFLNFMKKDGMSLIDAVHASSTLPAKLLKLEKIGSIAVGNKANILHFDGKKINLLTF